MLVFSFCNQMVVVDANDLSYFVIMTFSIQQIQ